MSNCPTPPHGVEPTEVEGVWYSFAELANHWTTAAPYKCLGKLTLRGQDHPGKPRNLEPQE